DDALIHPRGSQLWAWKDDYVKRIKARIRKRVPVWAIAFWLFRDREWAPDTTVQNIENHFLNTFRITHEESDTLFSYAYGEDLGEFLGTSSTSDDELFELIEYPPDASVEEGGYLASLELQRIGPATRMVYEPSSRLNIVTGDNSLGKTFLFECAWRSLTGSWISHPAVPDTSDTPSQPVIVSSLQTKRRRQKRTISYDFDSLDWISGVKQSVIPGLVIYVRFDGSAAVYDPERTSKDEGVPQGVITMTRDEVWNGRRSDSHGRPVALCNGLYQDWIEWQYDHTASDQFDFLTSVLRHLSPSDEHVLQPGQPTRLPGDSRRMPTVSMPFGDVALEHCSAAIRRITGLAYLLVWSWNEHLRNCSMRRKKPGRSLMLFVDEIEAHLHPNWQRMILEALAKSLDAFEPFVQPQLHIATHSPLVLASAEPIFDERSDRLHHLSFKSGRVELSQVPFEKRGRSDRWLTSPMFGLEQPRSRPGERAIMLALEVQSHSNPDVSLIRTINQDLEESLAQDDDFWPRWRFFVSEFDL
ncbi:MAG: hypothetical protein EOP06_09450, partial [Proteobacteria bacterium]